MKTLLLSFSPDWFSEVENGKTKFEYRKNFPDGQTTVYFYVSSPIKSITGKAIMGERQPLSSWLDIYKNHSKEVLSRINEYQADCRYAIPIIEFQKTNVIHLDTLRKEVPGFVVPRMYYFIDNLPLLDYLNENLIPCGEMITHDFSKVDDSEICP